MSFIGILLLLSPLQLITASPHGQYTQPQIDNAWIKVPWSHGGHYWHNTLTRDDQDNPPTCLLKKY